MKYALAFTLAVTLGGCMTFRIPIGKDEQYGSVDLTVTYNLPPNWKPAPAAQRNGLAK